ncbi:MAG: MerR family transcriptional regulator [Alphaproteobacteria bacterium HGW-Alphaproteobacteria-4]|nr:MAG: MerR family transcriptional regulator [Alphaproteobacteria bacterium HGW-Alphaproteobacteria-4]
MTKAADAFRTISEVAEALDTPAHVLRFWESKFSQVKPVKLAGGRRYYRPSDLALLAGIKVLLHERGLSIRGVQKILREDGVKHVAAQANVRLGEAAQAAPAPVAAELPRKPVIVRPAKVSAPAEPATTEPAKTAPVEPVAVEPVAVEPDVAPEPAAAAAAAEKLAGIAPMLFEALPEQPVASAPRPAPTPAAATITLWSERLRNLAAPADPAVLARLNARAMVLRNRLAALART